MSTEMITFCDINHIEKQRYLIITTMCTKVFELVDCLVFTLHCFKSKVYTVCDIQKIEKTILSRANLDAKMIVECKCSDIYFMLEDMMFHLRKMIDFPLILMKGIGRSCDKLPDKYPRKIDFIPILSSYRGGNCTILKNKVTALYLIMFYNSKFTADSNYSLNVENIHKIISLSTAALWANTNDPKKKQEEKLLNEMLIKNIENLNLQKKIEIMNVCWVMD